jgi:hypothetical protein
MVRRYLRDVFSRAVRQAWCTVIADSWKDLGVKLFLGLVFLVVLYQGTRWGIEEAAFSDELKGILAGLEAAAVGVTLLFLVNLLFVAPYQLWREERARAEAAEAALTGTEAARIIADCTVNGVVDLERLRTEMDRITDPNREYRETWDALEVEDRLSREATARARYEMRKITGGIGDPVAMGARLLDRDVTDADKRTRQEHRRELISICRYIAVEYAKSGEEESFAAHLEGHTEYLEIRRFLSADFMSKLNAPRTIYLQDDNSRLPVLVAMFLEEIDRLEGEWDL